MKIVDEQHEKSPRRDNARSPSDALEELAAKAERAKAERDRGCIAIVLALVLGFWLWLIVATIVWMV